MRREDVTILLDRIRKKYGAAYSPYGTFEEEEEGTGFRIDGIPATFSALCVGDTPVGRYDIQVESYPPNDYVFMTELGFDQFLEFIEKYRDPIAMWPLNTLEDV